MFFVPLIVCFFFLNFHVDKSLLKNKMMKDSAPSPPINVDFYDMLFCHHSFPPSLWALAFIDFFWFFIDFYDVLFGGHHFHSARAPLPFCFIAFLASHRRVERENNQNIENMETK